MQLIEGDVGVGATEGDAKALGCEDGFIEVFLSRSEGPGYGPCASDVRDIAAIFLKRGQGGWYR